MKKIIFFLNLFFLIIALLKASETSNNIPDTNIKNIEQLGIVEQIKAYLNLSEYYYERNTEKSVILANKSFELSLQKGIPQFQAKSLYAIGNGYYHLNKYDDAISNFKKAKMVYEQIESQTGIAQCLNRIGNTNQLKGNFEEALTSYYTALSIFKEASEKKEMARTLTNLGSIYQLYGDYKRAIDFHLESLTIYEQTTNKEGKAWAFLNIARLFKKMGDYEKALEYANKSIEIYDALAKSTGAITGVTLCLKEQGNIYQDMGNYDKALEFSLKVLDLNTKSNNKYGIANSLTSIGMIYFQKGEFDKSLENLKQSLQIKEELKDNVEISSTLRYIANNYINKNDFTTALEYLNRSLEIAKKLNLRDEIREDYYGLSSMFSKIGDFKKSLEYYQSYSILKDSLNLKDISEREMKYEFGKKQKILEFEQARQKEKLQQQKMITWAFIFGFFITILLAFSIYRNYDAKKKANKKLEHQQKLISDSIEYAKRIQHAILPQEKFIQQVLPEHFIFYKPRDIVSGDFYWVSKKGDRTIIVAADCTGHGVPGAFMSMLGVAFLNEIVNKQNIVEPDQILAQLRKNVIDSLHQKEGGSQSKDGMDIALCVIDTAAQKLYFSGAHNPLYFFKGKEFIEIKSNKMPIGIHVEMLNDTFTKHELNLTKGDTFYIFSDGYGDQFGGEKNEKFKMKNFKKLLSEIQDLPLAEQKLQIEKTFDDWKGKRNQIDDVLVIGIRI